MSKVFSFPSSVGAKPEPWIELRHGADGGVRMREVPAPSVAELARGTHPKLRDAHKDWKRQQAGYCEHCDEAPCLQTEDCPGGRHYERRAAVERHRRGESA